MQNGDHLLSKIQQDICWAYVIHSSINSYFFAFSTCPINNVLTLDIQVITPEVYRGYVFGNPVIPLVCDWMSRVIIYLRLLHGETAPSQLLLLRMHIVRLLTMECLIPWKFSPHRTKVAGNFRMIYVKDSRSYQWTKFGRPGLFGFQIR